MIKLINYMHTLKLLFKCMVDAICLKAHVFLNCKFGTIQKYEAYFLGITLAVIECNQWVSIWTVKGTFSSLCIDNIDGWF